MALIMMIPLATYKNINMKEEEEEEKRKFSNYQRKEKKKFGSTIKKALFLTTTKFCYFSSYIKYLLLQNLNLKQINIINN